MVEVEIQMVKVVVKENSVFIMFYSFIRVFTVIEFTLTM